MELKFLADNPDAVPLVARWYYDQWVDKVTGISYEETCQRIRDNLNRDRIPLKIVAAEGDNILGAAELKFREMDIYPEKEHWLGGVYVAAEARGRGIASQLVEGIVEIAKAFEVQTLYLQTEKLDGGGLYAKLGWTPIEQVHYRGHDVLVMERRL